MKQSTKSQAQREQGLFARTIEEVRHEWTRISGERLSRGRVFQILQEAERKLRRRFERIGGAD